MLPLFLICITDSPHLTIVIGTWNSVAKRSSHKAPCHVTADLLLVLHYLCLSAVGSEGRKCCLHDHGNCEPVAKYPVTNTWGHGNGSKTSLEVSSFSAVITWSVAEWMIVNQGLPVIYIMFLWISIFNISPAFDKAFLRRVKWYIVIIPIWALEHRHNSRLISSHWTISIC